MKNFTRTTATIFAAFTMLSCALVPASAWSAEDNTKTKASAADTTGPRLKLRIAVNQGKWTQLQYQNYQLDENVVRALQAKIIEKLQATGMFQVFEREATSDAQADDESRRAAERAASGQATGAHREAQIPADYIITPEIVGFNMTKRGGGGLVFGPVDLRRGSSKAEVEMSLRIFSAGSRSILDSASGKGSVEQKEQSAKINIFGAGISDQQFQQSPVGQAVEAAINQAIDKMVTRLKKEPWQAMVVGVSENTGRFTINRGTSSGLEVGMEFDAYEVEKAGTDPETGEQIPGDEKKIGRVRIERVTNGAAYAVRISGQGIKAKTIIRLPQ